MEQSKRATTRERLVHATAILLSERGPSGTGTAQILNAADAPRGSFYFHFPGGKDELVQAAVRSAGDETAERIREVFESSLDLPSRMAQYFDVVASQLRQDGFLLGCAVGATTLDMAATSAAMRETTFDVFTSWIATITSYLSAEGVPSEQARPLALNFVSAVEGATMIALALRDEAPLRAAGEAMRDATIRALARA
jgi:TetR/AcrR family transcriptional regulator, lmrAB and yxaGH operons repressor